MSPSIMPSEFFTVLREGVDVEGSISIVVTGEDFDTDLDGAVVVGGSIATEVVNPVGAFDDFALFELTDPDPAQTYVSWNNTGQHSGESDYTQAYGLFHPPLDYPVSGGVNAWNRAQYMAAGFEFVSVPAGAAQNLTRVSVENLPLAGATDASPVPRAYDPPRALHTIVHPSRLNYCPNPGFEVSTAGWSAVGTAALSRVATGLNITGRGTPTVPDPGINTVVSTPAAAISPGQQLATFVYVYAPSLLSQKMVLQIAWQDSFGNPLLGASARSVGTAVAPAAATWTKLSVTGIAPINAVYYEMQVTFVSVPLSTDLVWCGDLTVGISTPPATVVTYVSVSTSGWSCNAGGGTEALSTTHVPTPAYTGGYRSAPSAVTSGYSNPSSLDVPAATGTAVGDLILIFAAGYDINGFTCPGFTAVTMGSQDGQTFIQLLYRTADGTEGSTFTVSCSSYGAHGFSIVQATIPAATIDVAGVSTYSQGPNTIGIPGVTVSAAGELLISFWAGWISYYNQAIAGVPPAGFTTQAQAGTGSYTAGAQMADNGSVAAGATGTIYWGPYYWSGYSGYLFMAGINVAVKAVPVTSGGSGSAVLVTPSGIPAPIPPDTTPHSMKIIASAAGDGAKVSITNLIVGDTYTASCYVQPGTGMTDTLSCPDGSATILNSGTLSDVWTTGGWVRLWFIFRANASSVALSVTSGIGTSYVDDVLVEMGSLIGTYFDGNYTSADYGWETGGTAGLTRSYYYANLAVSKQTIKDILTKHTPMGVIALAPLYFVPPESHPSPSPFVSKNQFQVFTPDPAAPAPVLIAPPVAAPPATPGSSVPTEVPGYQTYAPGGKTLAQLAASAGITMAQLKSIDPGVVAKFGTSKVLPPGTGYWVPRHK